MSRFSSAIPQWLGFAYGEFKCLLKLKIVSIFQHENIVNPVGFWPSESTETYFLSFLNTAAISSYLFIIWALESPITLLPSDQSWITLSFILLKLNFSLPRALADADAADAKMQKLTLIFVVGKNFSSLYFHLAPKHAAEFWKEHRLDRQSCLKELNKGNFAEGSYVQANCEQGS